MLAFCIQRGGGLYIMGTATLTNTNVFSNEASVRPPYAPSLSLLQRPAGTLHMTCTRVLAFLRSMMAVGSL